MSIAQPIKAQTTGRPMTVQILKTKAETALTEAFAEIEAGLPGGNWLRQLRRAAIGAFTAEGLPHRRVEEWKFTDLRAQMREAFPIATGRAKTPSAAALKALVGDALPGADLSKVSAVFIDGAGVSEQGLSDLSDADSAFLAKLADHPPAWLETEISDVSGHVTEGTLALNTALFSDGAVIDIAKGRSIETPIALIFADGDNEARTVTTRNVVRVGAGAKVVLVECHLASDASRQVNTLTQIVVGDGADVVHVKLVASRAGSVHLGRTIAKLGANASYRPFQFVSGDGLVRNDISVTFRGQNSTFDLGSALLTNRQGHADTTLVVDHAVPHCTSRELVKCVLTDRARAVFQGKVIVRPDAQKTDGKQMAQALMLSPDAEFDSKPELEIYADDVVCGHGSTSAEIDPELIFYLRSRGIPLSEAQAMLVESFIGEAIDKAEPERVQDALRGLARAWLADQAQIKQS
jgi:Fe-S cluster assembly protein SufD